MTKKLSLTLIVLLLSTATLYAGKGKVRVASDVEGAYIYVDGKKKAMTGEGFTSILLEEGEHTVKVAIIKSTIEIAATKKVFVGEETSMKIKLLLNEKIEEKREEIEKAEAASETAREMTRGRWKRVGDTVIDAERKLMWQDESYTQSEKKAYDKEKNHGKAGNWKYAKSYCSRLTLEGYSDWRLPTKKELYSIVDKSRKPAIKPIFNHALTSFYWSSSASPYSSRHAWGVVFGDGSGGWGGKFGRGLIRCVRDND